MLSTPFHKYGNVCGWGLRGEVAKRGGGDAGTSATTRLFSSDSSLTIPSRKGLLSTASPISMATIIGPLVPGGVDTNFRVWQNLCTSCLDMRRTSTLNMRLSDSCSMHMFLNALVQYNSELRQVSKPTFALT